MPPSSAISGKYSLEIHINISGVFNLVISASGCESADNDPVDRGILLYLYIFKYIIYIYQVIKAR